MRPIAALLLISLLSCGPTLECNTDPLMTRNEMLRRATLVFIGIIEHQRFDASLFLRFRAPDRHPYWKVLRRDVRVELVLQGEESHRRIPIYEISWTGGTSGDWNYTRGNQRYLFLVRNENGRYHVVRDWWRSIFPIGSGPHHRLPLDDSHPFWERFALLNWWYPPQAAAPFYIPFHADPGDALGPWRSVKLLRGIVRHPNRDLRFQACHELLRYEGLDECYEQLSTAERSHFKNGGYTCCSPDQLAGRRLEFQQRDPRWYWKRTRDKDWRRLYTTVRDPNFRARFCSLWQSEYPNDRDTGCPPNPPHPASIVTENGDIPLAHSLHN